MGKQKADDKRRAYQLAKYHAHRSKPKMDLPQVYERLRDKAGTTTRIEGYFPINRQISEVHKLLLNNGYTCKIEIERVSSSKYIYRLSGEFPDSWEEIDVTKSKNSFRICCHCGSNITKFLNNSEMEFCSDACWIEWLKLNPPYKSAMPKYRSGTIGVHNKVEIMMSPFGQEIVESDFIVPTDLYPNHFSYGTERYGEWI